MWTSVLVLSGILCAWSANATPAGKQPVFPSTTKYPLPNQGNVRTHDPNIVEYNNAFYMYKGGVHLPIHKAPALDGPWEMVGTVLDGPSIVEKGNSNRPWAPTTIERNGRFYCFYTVSSRSNRDSAIGVASSDNPEGGGWKDHGALISTQKGPRADIWPYTVSNAIDASYIEDQDTHKPYLLFGSFWHGIFQVPLADDLLSVEDKDHPDAKNLVYLPKGKRKPDEGSFMSYHEPYYYLWFSHGKCCYFDGDLPKAGEEYSIRVGRSRNVRGPFVDRDGVKLSEGGGSVVYGSNNGVTYAPGGLGVLPGNSSVPSDILYYHYLNASMSLDEAYLGYSYLSYEDGWPSTTSNTSSRPGLSYHLLAVLFTGTLLWLCS
ncbi:endo-1,5-alpha-L-arabinosidase [Aspergillus taichungensis]|uniref:Arabinan endo-1,5-alpha-L-arabinosidase n=1 Tax=Aspergillus taichungensis TaxID=482145 RepID=A0A2J5HTK5_9EURO|nr:endo-1,5-alpha-L-arabinosidase [Aspergillus taichungensis]